MKNKSNRHKRFLPKDLTLNGLKEAILGRRKKSAPELVILVLIDEIESLRKQLGQTRKLSFK